MEDIIFDKVPNIHHWYDYGPEEHHYCLYSHNLLMACHKIEDVYRTMGLARICLENIRAEDFGELIDGNDPLSKALMRSTFINNSISYYNYCIDLSWQVLWLYYNPSEIEYSIHKREDYLKATKDCTLEGLKLALTLAKQNKLSTYVESFFTRDTTKCIREKYNYIKHRGVYHIDGLGENYKQSVMNYNGFRLPLLYREELNLDNIMDELIEFDKSFVEYFEIIISSIVPKDYLECTGCNIEDYIIYLNKYLNSLKR